MISQNEVLLRLVVALILGALVGIERERGERAAGLRTHALVCLGSCLIMITSTYGFQSVVGKAGFDVDPSRVAAQVVSGIGFLGAGTILLRKEIVRGLTTAAAIWVVAGIGLAVGGGLYLPAVETTVGALVVLAIFRPIERKFFAHRRIHRVVVEVHPQTGQMTAIRNALAQAHVEFRAINIKPTIMGSIDRVELECSALSVGQLSELIDNLRQIPGLVSITHDPLQSGMTHETPTSESGEETDEPEN